MGVLLPVPMLLRPLGAIGPHIYCEAISRCICSCLVFCFCLGLNYFHDVTISTYRFLLLLPFFCSFLNVLLESFYFLYKYFFFHFFLVLFFWFATSLNSSFGLAGVWRTGAFGVSVTAWKKRRRRCQVKALYWV
jgi:hypothetical protein